jgi:hypothetical protein
MLEQEARRKRKNFEDLGVVGDILLEWGLNKCNIIMWNEFL